MFSNLVQAAALESIALVEGVRWLAEALRPFVAFLVPPLMELSCDLMVHRWQLALAEVARRSGILRLMASATRSAPFADTAGLRAQSVGSGNFGRPCCVVPAGGPQSSRANILRGQYALRFSAVSRKSCGSLFSTRPCTGGAQWPCVAIHAEVACRGARGDTMSNRIASCARAARSCVTWFSTLWQSLARSDCCSGAAEGAS